jgi:hypothetical protein
VTGEPESFRWRVHPAAERRGVALLVLVLLILLSALAGVWMRGLYWGIFAFLVLFLSLESFYLPTRYELTSEGVSVRKAFSRVERPWSAFRTAWSDALGITLSPFGRRHWLESYRGVRLRFAIETSDGQRTRIRARLREWLTGASVRLIGWEGEAASGEGRGEARPGPTVEEQER